VDNQIADRVTRWFDAYATPGDVFLPLVMVDSGNQISSGDVEFNAVYGAMIENSLDRETKAGMTVRTKRVDDILQFNVTLTNTSGETLSAANNATLTTLLYRQPNNSTGVPWVVRGTTTAIQILADGHTGSTSFEIDIRFLDMDRIHWLVIAEAQLDGSTTAYDTLQAVTGE
jgi:hypothetical protein